MKCLQEVEWFIRRNFDVDNFSWIAMDFELKFKNRSEFWIWIEFKEIWNSELIRGLILRFRVQFKGLTSEMLHPSPLKEISPQDLNLRGVVQGTLHTHHCGGRNSGYLERMNSLVSHIASWSEWQLHWTLKNWIVRCLVTQSCWHRTFTRCSE
jgi:hypothetical protein